MQIEDQLTELKGAYAKFAPGCAAGLMPPAPEESIHKLENDLGFILPDELRALLRVHGGQEPTGAADRSFFGYQKLLSPSEILDHYRVSLQTYKWHRSNPPDEFPPQDGVGGWWNPRLVPFASWDAYDLCIHADRGDVWNFEPYGGLISYFPSIGATLRLLIDQVKADEEPDLPFFNRK